MKGINPAYLAKLDPEQQITALNAHGKFFLDQFVFVKGEHCYVVGPTGSGKTNKGMNLVNWLRHTETIIWISSGKDNETIPLLFMGTPVRIITPKYHDVEIRKGKTRYEPHPEVVQVPDAGSAWWAVKKGCINIFEFRNAFWEKDNAIAWMIELFSTLASWTRLRMMPHISPAAIFMDESKWIVAGTRVTSDGARVKASEIITENAMDIRAYGFRLIIFAQGFIDIPPAMRDNMPCFFLCNGAEIEVSRKLRYHCNPTMEGWKKTSQYKRNEAKFVDRYGNSMPISRPLAYPWFPKKDEDRKIAEHLKVIDIGFHDKPPSEAEPLEECFPDLGRYAALAVPPEKWIPTVSRSDIPGGVLNDG